MFITVQAFDDTLRSFVPKLIRLQNVNAVDPTPTILWGEKGSHACHKTWMVGYWFWLSASSLEAVLTKTAAK